MEGRLLAMLAMTCALACGPTTYDDASDSWSNLAATDTPAARRTFSVREGRLWDHTDHEFVIRGINSPHAYFRERAYQALGRIRELGFNTVRIVWCADTLLRPGRCDPKDVHSTSELEAILDELRSLQMVGLLVLQNATGSNDPAHLEALVDWYLKPDVKALLQRSEDMLILNVANEWYGDWHDPEQIYLESYQQQIARLRAAGLAHVLVIDARGWGQQFSSIPENYQALLATDPNLLFSVHMYDLFASAETVQTSLATLRERKIPALIGEFACGHYPGQTVACETIMEEAGRSDWQVGYVAWSYSGNASPLENLDLVSSSDWWTLTAYGETIVNHPKGIKATSRQACIFPSAHCGQKEGT